jgi:hypothetical protein
MHTFMDGGEHGFVAFPGHHSDVLVPYQSIRDNKCEDFGACEEDYDGLRDAASACGRGATDFGKVISTGSGDLLGDADFAQALELPREARRGKPIEDGRQVGATESGDVGLGF